MNSVAQLVVIVGISAIAAGATYRLRGAPDLSPAAIPCDPASLKDDELCLEQVQGEGLEKFLWVDARSRSEWEKSGYAGSILWNLDAGEDPNAFAAEAAPLMFDGAKVLVYCSDESCGLSREVAKQIRALGMGNDVFVLHGGWSALRSAGLVTDSN